MHVSEVSGLRLGSGTLTIIGNAGVFVREIRKGRENEAAFHQYRMSRLFKMASGIRSYLIRSHLPLSRIMEAVGQNHALAKMLVS